MTLRLRGSVHGLPLSPREKELLEALSVGMRPQEVGERWSITRHTLQQHIENIKRKLGCRTVWQACIEYGRQHPRHIYF